MNSTKRIIYLIIFILTFMLSDNVTAVDLNILKPEFSDTFYNKKQRIYLDGTWKYKLVSGKDDYQMDDDGIKNKYYTFNFNDSAWKSVTIPGYFNERSKTGIAYFRKNFKVPKEFNNKRFILYLQGVGWEPVVYVNGVEVARPLSLAPGSVSERHKIDITDHLKLGTFNKLCIRIFQAQKMRRQSGSGIFAPVRINIEEPIYASKVFVTPQLPDKIHIKAEIVNTTKKISILNIYAKVSPWNLKQTGTTSELNLGKFTLRPGKNKINFKMTIKDPVQWDIYNPFLYGLKLKAGKYDSAWVRFGLREIKIKGKNFYLNDNKIFLYGKTFNEGNIGKYFDWDGKNALFWHNHNGFLRKYLTLLKKNNCSVIYRISQSTPDTFSDLCDELGILQVPAYKILMTKISNFAKRLIVKEGAPIAGIWRGPYPAVAKSKTKGQMGSIGPESFDPERPLDMEGLKKYVKMAVTRNIEADYNHPSIIAFVAEGEANRVPGLVELFPWYKKVLREVDPMRPFSSAQTFCAQAKNIKGKFVKIKPPPYDFQISAGGMLGGSGMSIVPYTFSPFMIKWWNWNYINKYYPKNPIPVVATESLTYGTMRVLVNPHIWKWHLRTYSPILKDGEVDYEKYAKLFHSSERKNSLELLGWWPSRKFIKIAGIRNCLSKEKMMHALAQDMKRYIEQARIHDENIQGFGSVCGPLLQYESYKKMIALDPNTIKEANPMGRAFKQACAPYFICSPVYNDKHNIIAGAKFKPRLYCFNAAFEPKNNIDIKLEIQAPDGKIIKSAKIPVGTLKACSKKQLNWNWTVPPETATGEYVFKLLLRQAGKTLSKNAYDIYILSRKDYLKKAVNNNVSVAYFQDESNDSRMEQTLKRLGVKLNKIASLDKLKNYKYLIIGGNAITEKNAEQFKVLKNWIQKGGKLLCLEQNHKGKVPWQEELSWSPLKVRYAVPIPRLGTGVNPLRREHPVFDGIAAKKHWTTWNSPWGQLYKGIITPLDKDVIGVGAGLGRSERPLPFGMVIVEKKQGQGSVIFSQLETTIALKHKDAIANKYLYNLIKYFLKK